MKLDVEEDNGINEDTDKDLDWDLEVDRKEDMNPTCS